MKQYAIILCLLLAKVVFAQEVDLGVAELVSQNFFKNSFNDGIQLKNSTLTVSTEGLTIKDSRLKMYNNHPSYYVVNFEQGGWVITSAHKAVGPVLAYSAEGYLGSDEELPAAFTDWMSQYEQVIDEAFSEKKKIAKKEEKWKNYMNNSFEKKAQLKSTYTSEHFYLIDTHWGQSSPNTGSPSTPAYNYYMGDGCSSGTGHYLAGCTAVAIGQIMKYWEFATGSYADFDWWDMPDELNQYGSRFDIERKAISYLLKRVGDRLDADYGCDGTSALPLFDAKYTFREFGYNNSSMSHNLKTYNKWVELLKDELDAGRPIQYNSRNHSFVCDGYKYGTHTFHFNLGWLSYDLPFDSWFDFEDLPTDGGTTFHECLTGIKPNWRTQWDLQNVTVSTSSSDPWINKQTYQARSITAAGNGTTFKVEGGSDCRLLAYSSIKLKQGVKISAGSTLLARRFANSEGTLKFMENDFDDQSTESVSKEAILAKVFPNPSYNGKFKLVSSSVIEGAVSVTVTNLAGSLMFKGKSEDFTEVEIDLSAYPKGTYFVELQTEEQIFSLKMLSF